MWNILARGSVSRRVGALWPRQHALWCQETITELTILTTSITFHAHLSSTSSIIDIHRVAFKLHFGGSINCRMKRSRQRSLNAIAVSVTSNQYHSIDKQEAATTFVALVVTWPGHVTPSLLFLTPFCVCVCVSVCLTFCTEREREREREICIIDKESNVTKRDFSLLAFLPAPVPQFVSIKSNRPPGVN